MFSLRFSTLSFVTAVWMLLLVDCFSQISADDDQDGPSFTHRSNNTQNFGLTGNQAGRLPINNLNSSPFLRLQQSSQFGSPFQSGFPLNHFGLQQQNGFQQSGLGQTNGFQQTGFPSSFQSNGFQQNGFGQQQQSGFPQNGFQQNGFNQNGLFPQLGNIPQQLQQQQQQQQNGVLLGQGTQFNSIGLQNQLAGSQFGIQNQLGAQLGLQSQLGAQMGLQSQLGGGNNNLQNQLALQNQLNFGQNPFELSLLQQNQFGLQNQLALKNQLDLQSQLGIQPNPFGLQNQLGFQSQLGQQQNPFALQQFNPGVGGAGILNNELMGSQFGLGNPQFGSSTGLRFGQLNGLGLGNFPQNNIGTSFSGGAAGLQGKGPSSSLLGSNQVLLQGGQFQDSSSSSGNQFGTQNRFPFATSSFSNNRLPAGNNGNGLLGGSQFSGSQFNNQFSNDPFIGQRSQLSSLDNQQQQQRPFRNGGFSSNERSLSFNDTTDTNTGFQFQRQQLQQQQQLQLQQQQQQQQQHNVNPFLEQQQQLLASLNRQPFDVDSPTSPFVQQSRFQDRNPFAFHQQTQQLGNFPSSSLISVDQQQQQRQPLMRDSPFSTAFNQQVNDLDDAPFSSLNLQQQQQRLPGSIDGLSHSSLNNQQLANQFNSAPSNGPLGNSANNFATRNPSLTATSTVGTFSSDQKQAIHSFQSQQNQQPQQPSIPLPIPVTGFSCDGRSPGYYADMKNGCQTYHICIADGSGSGLKRSFACPNGTLFDQASSVCQWKDDIDCSKSHLFYPRSAASTNSPSTLHSSSEIRPTMSPFNTQIPSPTESNDHQGNTTPSGFLFSGVGQPSPAMGSLDAGRSLEETRRQTDENAMRPTRNLFSPPQFRPKLFRPSERLDDHRRA